MLMLKERFKRFREDSKILLVMTIMPLIITYFFSSGENELKIALIQNKTIIDLKEDYIVPMTESEAMTELQNGKIDGAIFLGDKNLFLVRQKSFGNEYVKKTLIKKMKEKKVLDYLNELSGKNLAELPVLPVQIKKIEKTLDKEQEKAKTLLGFMVFFAMYPVSYSIASILKEKREGTWQRQLVAPINKWQLIVTNLIYSTLLGLTQIYIVIFTAKFIFNVSFKGNFFMILFLFTLFVLTVASMSLMLTTIIKNENQLGSALPIITTGSAMLAGCFWPFEFVSNKILRILGYMMPQRWLIDGINKVGIREGNLSLILPNILILVCMTLIFFVIASKRED